MALLAISTAGALQAQDITQINSQDRLNGEIDKFTNGYAERVSGADMIYGNEWDSFDAALLTRATNGKDGFSWKSAPVKISSDGAAHLLHYMALDQANPSCEFHLYINGEHVGDIENFHSATYSKSFPNGAKIDFERIAQNVTDDGYCFMELTLPSSLVKEGEEVTLKLEGAAQMANNWIMLFKKDNLVNEIKRRVEHDSYFEVSEKGGALEIVAPLSYVGRELSVTVNGAAAQKCKFTKASNCALATLPAKDGVKSIAIDCFGENILSIADITSVRDTTYVEGSTLNKLFSVDGTIIRSKTYSSTLEEVKNASTKWWSNAKFHVLVSSHQDIAWMDTPYRCIELRDGVIIAPALDLLDKYDDYCYDIEDALMIEEFLERNPSERPRVEKLIAEGRLGIGATYTQPYEEMQSSEALARQFYFGKRFLMNEFKGLNPQTYWNVDVPGRTLQMPQIMKKSGVNMLQYSRHERGMYNWYSPDSSFVKVFTPGHYTVASAFLRKLPDEGIGKYIEYCDELIDYRQDKSKEAVIPMLSAEDMSPAHSYYHWIDKFKDYEKDLGVDMPEMVHSTSDMFYEELVKSDAVLPNLVGERPNIWMYIHGAGHEEALTTYREANRRATFAETFNTIDGLLKGSLDGYPKRQMDILWKDIIYADHGWGGNGGNVTDSLFLARYKNANTIAGELSRDAAASIASRVKFNEKLGIPVVVFNSLSTEYSSPVRFAIDMSKMDVRNYKIVDEYGNVTPSYVSTSWDNDKLKFIAYIEFLATDLPSVGYKTYYISPGKDKARKDMNPTESKYYKLHFDENNRLTQISDLELGVDLFDDSKFEVGEVITLESVGNGAGEFSSFQPVSMNGFDKSSNYDTSKWKMKECNPLFTEYTSHALFEDAAIYRYIKIYNDIKRIDFETHVNGFNGKDYREFRQVFALKDKGEVRYEVPFGTVTVGKDEIKEVAGERYLDVPSEIHPRSIANWIASNNGEVDVKITSSVVMADYIDPTDNPLESTVLQPILFASRRSCHWLGEFYSQKGHHKFNFSLRSDAPESVEGDLNATAANYKPFAVVNPESYKSANLAESCSFFSSDSERISFSTIKKHEDKDEVVVRLYDAVSSGEASSVKINSYFDIEKATITDMIEMEEFGTAEDNTVNVSNRGIETISLEIK